MTILWKPFSGIDLFSGNLHHSPEANVPLSTVSASSLPSPVTVRTVHSEFLVVPLHSSLPCSLLVLTVLSTDEPVFDCFRSGIRSARLFWHFLHNLHRLFCASNRHREDLKWGPLVAGFFVYFWMFISDFRSTVYLRAFLRVRRQTKSQENRRGPFCVPLSRLLFLSTGMWKSIVTFCCSVTSWVSCWQWGRWRCIFFVWQNKTQNPIYRITRVFACRNGAQHWEQLQMWILKHARTGRGKCYKDYSWIMLAKPRLNTS